MGMLVTLASMALIHLSKADIEIPIRLNHYTTKANLGSIMMSGFINSPSGKNYFTSDWYCDGAEAQSKLAMRNKPDVFINLMLGKRKDSLMGPSIVQPATYGNLTLPGGGTEYYSTNTIFIWTRFPVVFPLF